MSAPNPRRHPEGDLAPRHSPAALALIGASLLLVVSALVGLGTWQVHRLAWKRDLVARVDVRVHAAPVPAPGPAAWSGLTRDADEYRPVVARGMFANDRETYVRAVTALGGGSWVMTPFRTEDGVTILVNRGFVPPERRDPASRLAGQVVGATSVAGLLRFTEPGGGFLQSNDPAADLWVSRDVAAITAARDVAPAAPYFVDAGATPGLPGAPVGGLTVIAFANNHLLYAVIWYTLAAMLAGAAILLVRDERRRRRS